MTTRDPWVPQDNDLKISASACEYAAACNEVPISATYTEAAESMVLVWTPRPPALQPHHEPAFLGGK